MKNFVEELKWRGMLAQIMPGTEEFLQRVWYRRILNRPYCRLSTYWTPMRYNDVAPFTAMWTQALFAHYGQQV